MITGGCGFLGQHLTKSILKEFPKAKIKVLDLKGNPDPLFDFSPRVKFALGGDICRPDTIKKEFKGVDTVIHLAGIVSFSLKDKILLRDVNVRGTANVLKLALDNKVSRFLHISSVAALGYSDKRQPVDENFVFDWKIAHARKKYYMLTKHLADVEVNKARETGLNAVVLYPGLMYGPGDLTNSARLINAIKKRKIPFNMPGGTNIIDVRDVAQGIVAAMKSDLMDGDYLLSGHNVTFRQSNRVIAKVLGVKPPRFTLPKGLNPVIFPLWLFMEARAKDKLELTADNVDSAFKFRYFDNSKAREKLKWKPDIPFKRTIEDTIKWMNKNGHFEE